MTSIAVIVTVLAYIAVLFAVAWFSGRRADNAGFFTGNRRTPWYMAGFAMIGAAISGVTFISVPGSVATDGFSYMQMVAGFTVGQFVVAFVLIPTFYRLKVVSLYEYLDDRFGVASHRTGAWFFFISKMLGAALRIYVVCAVMQQLVFSHYGLPFWFNAAVTMAFVWLYTQQGGVKSLIWTDTLKTFCLVASLVLSIVFIMQALGMSLPEMSREVASSPYSTVFFFDDPSSDRYFWKMFFAGIVLLIAMTGLDQDMMQRNMSCATPRDSQKNIVLTAISQLFVIFLFLVLGVLLYIYIEKSGLALPAKSDQVFSQVAVNGGLPLIVGILFVVGLISSTYSAAGSALTALTTSFTVDILDGTKRFGEKRLTRLRRGVHMAMAVGMVAVILAFEYLADDSVINLVYKVAGYTYGPILGMFAFGMFTRLRVRDGWMPLVAVAAPILSGLLQYAAKELWGYQIGFELLIYNAGFTFLGMILLVKHMKNKLLLSIILIFILGNVFAVDMAADINVCTRREIGATLTRIVAREVSGGSVKVEGVKMTKKSVELYTTIGMSYYPFREENVQAIYDSVRKALPADLRKADIRIITDKCEISELIPMAFRTKIPKDKKERPIAFINRSARPLVMPLSGAVAPTRGLSGRHIALWQSHGRYFDQTSNCWKWQRSRLWMTCEDLYTQSFVLPYLVPMLENAGAYVMMPRERDVQKHEVLADNDARGQYRETGAWQDGGMGFAHKQTIYLTGENPFRQGTTRKTHTVTDGAESRAVWSADIPERGEYAVYVSYESTTGSADDVVYTISHLGGESRYEVNQTMGGGTWIYLGTFLLDAGSQDVVSLSNLSRLAGRTVSADAVKIGGGYGNIARTVCDSLRKPDIEYVAETSGYPRFCEGARYWLQWAGFEKDVYTPKNNKDDYKDDFMSRAHWVNKLMGGSERLRDSEGLRIPIDMALAFHSDAGVRAGDEVVGTLGIFYTKDNNGRFAGGAGRYRSRDLTDIVMSQIVSDIRQTYEPQWIRRGLWNRSYYEARVPGAPTMLLELLSHQNFADMRLGNDPRFKFLVSRAIYKGILRYINSQYGTPYAIQPLPVEAFSTEFEGTDGVRLIWSPKVDDLEPTASPTGYMVYTRIGDAGFDAGRYVTEPTMLVTQKQGEIYSYKVTAVNDGGESFPSEILAACRVADERGTVLVVNGFDRICAPQSLRVDSLSMAGFQWGIDDGVPYKRDISFIGSQTVYDLSMARCEDDKIALGACEADYETDVIGGNTFDYPYLHGCSIAAAGYSFCSTSVHAVENGRAGVENYSAMDLILGKQRSTTIGRGASGWEFKTFTPALQSALRKMLAAGGSLFVSGSYVISDLSKGKNTTDDDRAFAREVLHCIDGGNMHPRQPRVRVMSSNADFSRGEYRFCDEIRPDMYRIETMNALVPAGRGAFGVMRTIGENKTAGVACDADVRTFVMGFPFEALMTRAERDRVMHDALRFLVKDNVK